ncbi:MAG: hypothetical protein HYU33_05180 [Candidatus Omnitrophica bacterium]|nr:hypothetical protein [Candidatus Omnitrophota bacterium]
MPGPIAFIGSGFLLLLSAAAFAQSGPANTVGNGHQEREAAMIESLWIAERKLAEFQAVSRHLGSNVRIFINGVQASFTGPVVVLETTTVALPLREVAPKLSLGLVELGEGQVQLISPKGWSGPFRIAAIENHPVVTLEQLAFYGGIGASFDLAHQRVDLRTPAAGKLQTSVIEKPPEEPPPPTDKADAVSRAVATAGDLSYVPEAARPTVDLRWREGYSYQHQHRGPLFRSLSSSLTGRVLDYSVQYELSQKDINGVFDYEYAYLNLNKPGLFIGLLDQSVDLAPFRVQSDGFEGVKVAKAWNDRHQSTFAWGQNVDNTISISGGSVKYIGRLLHWREEMSPVPWSHLRGGLLYLENETDLPEQVGLTNFPRTNMVSFGGATLDLPNNLSIMADVARADYRPDNSPKETIHDWDWRLGSEWDKEKFDLGFTYEFVGDKYASVGNPEAYQDFSGLDLHGGYRITDRWGLFGNVFRYRNNVEDDPTAVTSQNLALSLSSGYQLTLDQSVNLSYSHFMNDPSGPDPGSSSRTHSYRIDYFLPFLFKTRLLLNYNLFQTFARTAGDSLFHMWGTSLFKSYGTGSNWYLSQLLTQKYADSDVDSIDYTTSLNLDHHLFSSLSLPFNFSYTRGSSDSAESTDALSGSAGLRWRLLSDTTANVTYTVSSYNLRTQRWSWPQDWSLLFYVTTGVQLATPPAFGRLEGRVFQDENRNEVLDRGELGTGDVLVRVGDQEVLTDDQGRFKFPRAVPGVQRVILDVANLDPSSSMITRMASSRNMKSRWKELPL